MMGIWAGISSIHAITMGLDLHKHEDLTGELQGPGVGIQSGYKSCKVP